MDTPRSVLVKPVSADCNLRCRYCFYLPKGGDLYPETKRHLMTPDVLERLIREMLRTCPREAVFVWQGGEPLLAGIEFFQSVVRLQQTLGRSGQIVANALQTNGARLDDQLCRLFNRYNFLVGLSMDGPPDLHNLHRRKANGAGSHGKTLAAVHLLRKHRVTFNILACLTASSAGRATELYAYFKHLGVEALQFIPVVERRSDGSPRDFSITPDAYGDFLCELFDLWIADAERPFLRTFEDILYLRASQSPPACIWKERCGIYFLIEHNGDVYPCDFYAQKHLLVGNIMAESFEELAASDVFTEFAERKTRLGAACQTCRWRDVCRGGCPRHRDADGDNYFCAAYKRLFDHVWKPLGELLRDRGCV